MNGTTLLAPGYFTDTPLRIGNETQLLIDDHIIEDRWKLTRVLHQPEKYLRNPVLVKDKPWEGDMAYRPWVMRDEAYGRFRMWYQCFSFANYYGAGGPPYHVCYAESDGKAAYGRMPLPRFRPHQRGLLRHTLRAGSGRAGHQGRGRT
jgi:hypothetical protein